jgi:sulfite exporter TauE/SafE
VLGGATVMLVFGVATIPVLMALANTASLVQKFNLRNYAEKLAGWVVILYGYWIAYQGYMLLVTDGTACH